MCTRTLKVWIKILRYAVRYWMTKCKRERSAICTEAHTKYYK